MKKILSLLVILTCVCVSSRAAEEGAFVKAEASAKALYQTRLKQFSDDKDKLVLPGLLADRVARRVELSGVFNELDDHASVEFLIIGEDSENDYESLVRGFVKPSDVKKALAFIGMEPGRAYDPSTFSFWPRGERLGIQFEWSRVEEDGSVVPRSEAAEKLVYNSKEKKTLPLAGFTYSGSVMVTHPKHDGERLAADVYGPYCVVSLFNLREAVLDVPYTSYQNEVYASYVPNEKIRPAGGTPVSIVMTPEYAKGKSRVIDVAVSVVPGKESNGHGIRDLSYQVVVGDEAKVEKTLEGFLGILAVLNADGRDAFVSFDCDRSMTIASMRDLFELVNELAVAGRIRVEPPAEGTLFYRAYTPPEHFRKREDRISHPIELRLSKSAERVTGTLVYVTQKWAKNEIKPTLTVAEVPVGDNAELLKRLGETKWEIPVILSFVPGDLTRGELLDFVKGAQASYPTLHVYVDKP